ncbi:MAG: glycoside hydrolase family 76 protein [Solirubrobacteraceae bacterium]
MESQPRPIIRALIRRLPLIALLCVGIALFALVSEASRSDATRHGMPAHTAGPRPPRHVRLPSFAMAAQHGVDQLIGLGGRTPASQDPHNGLWGGHTMPNWWQSALALLSTVRYLERTHSTDPVYQRAIMLLYNKNVVRPNTHAPLDFANWFNDDTGWWGVAWLEAAKYELNVRHDRVNADKFLTVAEWDASFIDQQEKRCGGIEWGMGKPPDATTTAEYMALTAGLYGLRNDPGRFQDKSKAGRWLVDSQWALAYLIRTGLVNLKSGMVMDSIYGKSCKPYGRPLTYTEGEVAEALVQMGMALHQPAYYKQAAVFLRYAVNRKSGLVRRDGTLREHCEDVQYNCNRLQSRLDIPAYKGLLVNAIDDWSTVTRSKEFHPFLLTQAKSILRNAIVDGGSRPCSTAANCLFGPYWGPPPNLINWAIRRTVGGQESGIDAMTAVLPPAGVAAHRHIHRF